MRLMVKVVVVEYLCCTVHTVDNSVEILSSTNDNRHPPTLHWLTRRYAICCCWHYTIPVVSGPRWRMFRNAGRNIRNETTSFSSWRAPRPSVLAHSHESHESHQLGMVTAHVLVPVHRPVLYTVHVREGPRANRESLFAVCHPLVVIYRLYSAVVCGDKGNDGLPCCTFGRRHRISAVGHRSSLGTGW